MYIMNPNDRLALDWWKSREKDLEILKWIPKFPNLKTLGLVLYSQAPGGSVHCENINDSICRYPGRAFPRYSVLLRAIVEAIRPGEFEIILSGKDCPWLREEHAGGECGCRVSFEKRIGTYIKGKIAL